MQKSTRISLHERFSKQILNGNCISKNLEKETDFVDLGEIKKEKIDNTDADYPVEEDPLDINGMRKKGKIIEQENLENGQFTNFISSIHEGNKLIKCAFCETNFNQIKSMQLHIASVHEGKKPFKCSICDYKCSTKQKLTKHISSKHYIMHTFYENLC